MPGFETAFFAAFPCESGRKGLGAPMPGFADSERELWVELYRIPGHVFYPTVANSRRFVQPRGHGFTAAAEQDSYPRPDGPFFIEHCVLGSGTPGIAALTYSSASLNQVRNLVFPLDFRPVESSVTCDSCKKYVAGLMTGTDYVQGTWARHRAPCQRLPCHDSRRKCSVEKGRGKL